MTRTWGAGLSAAMVSATISPSVAAAQQSDEGDDGLIPGSTGAMISIAVSVTLGSGSTAMKPKSDPDSPSQSQPNIPAASGG